MFLIILCVSFVLGNVKIIKTPIFSFWPYINQHHVVLMDNYAIDFTPVEDNSIWKLLFGKNVKGEVRLRHLSDRFQKYNESKSRMISINTYHSIKNRKLKNVVKQLFVWGENCSMNLYTHNCQHFSSYAKKITKS